MNTSTFETRSQPAIDTPLSPLDNLERHAFHRRWIVGIVSGNGRGFGRAIAVEVPRKACRDCDPGSPLDTSVLPCSRSSLDITPWKTLHRPFLSRMLAVLIP